MKILSLFDGMACGHIAFNELGINVDAYKTYEIDKFAIKVATHNFPNIEELGDVFKADFKQYEGFDWLIGGSPCFEAGTLVYTDKGYVPIEHLKIGDKVLTHKNRFRAVTAIGSKISNTINLKACGMFPTVVTPNHPYYTREQISVINPKTRGKIKSLSEPIWKAVGEFSPNISHVGLNQISIEENPYNLSKEDCWILGRYVADGRCRISKRKNRKNSYQYQLILSIGSGKIQEFKDRIKLHHFSCYPHTKSVYRCVFSSMQMCRFIKEREFGENALTKVIPPTILNLPKELLKEFLEGYFSGDGCKIEHGITCTTVSKKLALSLQMAIVKVYNMSANISMPKIKPFRIIEGRKVSQHPQYVVTFKFAQKTQHARLVDSQMWTPVTHISKNAEKIVYNISVEEDESYTANNAIVHNCTYWSIAQSPDKRETTSSGIGWELFSQYVRALHEAMPKYFLYENNKSMSKEIRKAITETFGFEPICINSALVSAQNRHRLYWVGVRQEDGSYKKANIEQPTDKGIVVKDILDTSADSILWTDDKEKSKTLLSSYYKDGQFDLIRGGNYSRTAICNKVFELPSIKEGKQINSQATRVYGIEHKSCTQSSSGGGQGAKTGLYAVPSLDNIKVYKVENGFINYKGKQYPIKLADGYYTIRKMSVNECKRLQTVPEWYDMNCISNSQAYKCLGNGWTVDVIKHLIKSALDDSKNS